MADLLRDENDLLTLWRAGDRSAGELLMQHYGPLLGRFFQRRTTEHVEELVQDTLMACLSAIDRFEGRSSFRAFVFGIAHRQFLLGLRAKRVRKTPSVYEHQQSPPPSQLFASKEEAQNVTRALLGTALSIRQVLLMFYWEDLSVREIARTLEIPPSTVKSRLFRGRAALKKKMVSSFDPSGKSSHAPKPPPFLLPGHRSSPKGKAF